jgi:Tfp pilus assembly protein PilX
MAWELLHTTKGKTMGQGKKSERGVALILALISLLIVTSIGLSMMYMADTETSINSNYRDEQTAYYAAKAGLEEARDRMQPAATNSIRASLPTTLPGTANGALYIINPTGSETVAPWLTTNAYYDDEICKEVSGCTTVSGNQIPAGSTWYVCPVGCNSTNPALTASSTYAASPVLPYKWMRITLKTDGLASGWSGATQNFMYVDGKSANASYYVCWNGTNEITQSTACASPNTPVYMMTALAITPSGTRRMLQYELTQDRLNLTFPAALTMDGSNASLSTLTGPNSNPYRMEGADHAGCGGSATSASGPAIGVTNIPDIATIVSGIPSNRLDHYTGVDGTTPDVNNISSSLPANLNSVSSLNTLLATIKSSANQVYNSNQTSLANPGTSGAPQIIYINGDYSPSGSVTGYGILVVTGTFTPGGNVGWNGIVMVIGKGSMVGNGGGNNSYNGAVVVANTVDGSGNPLASLGVANFNFSGGGGNGINYSSGCIAQASSLSDYRIVSAREMMY